MAIENKKDTKEQGSYTIVGDHVINTAIMGSGYASSAHKGAKVAAITDPDMMGGMDYHVAEDLVINKIVLNETGYKKEEPFNYEGKHELLKKYLADPQLSAEYKAVVEKVVEEYKQVCELIKNPDVIAEDIKKLETSLKNTFSSLESSAYIDKTIATANKGLELSKSISKEIDAQIENIKAGGLTTSAKELIKEELSHVSDRLSDKKKGIEAAINQTRDKLQHAVSNITDKFKK
jgi:hypothetical protein